jgi:hypothetical protein
MQDQYMKEQLLIWDSLPLMKDFICHLLSLKKGINRLSVQGLFIDMHWLYSKEKRMNNLLKDNNQVLH